MSLAIDDDSLLRLPEIVRQHAIQLDHAIFHKQHFSAIVWAAVTLEALLEEILATLDQEVSDQSSRDRPDLGGMLSRLDAAVKKRSERLSGAAEVVDKAHSIRVSRNHTVHNTGRQKGDLSRQSEKIVEDLEFILKWWIDTLAKPADETTFEGRRVRCFLATINPDHPRHRAFLIDIKQLLKKNNIEPITVTLTEYDRNAPMTRVASVMQTCDTVLIIGLERTRAYLVCDREGTANQFEDTHRRYSSSWLHIEGGLAVGLGLSRKTFVICEENIWSEGVFDRGWNEFTPIVIPNLDVNSRGVQETIRRIAEISAESEGS